MLTLAFAVQPRRLETVFDRSSARGVVGQNTGISCATSNF